MKSLERVLVPSLLALALVAPACDPKSVPPWPYTQEPDVTSDGAADDGSADDGAAADGGTSDGGTSDDGASDDGASTGEGDQGMTGAGGIEATYGGPFPVACDGGLCSTDNYSLCGVASQPSGRGAGRALPVLAAVAGLAIAGRRRRKGRRSS